jgi:ATP-dependent Clp protease ATP-binding subunit ClpC
MTNDFVGPEGDPFAEFLARFFGGQRPRQIDIGRLLSQPARELVRGAAQYAAEHGSRDLDTQHLLRAALSAEPTRSLLSRAGADRTRTRWRRRSTTGRGPCSTRRAKRRPRRRCP